uniref:Cleft lip and palate transmembrane protein 1-like protein n=1 Tax=Arcella intermedia TaxID=1963864 RepID=A0A6B2L1W1_9EUKA
MFYPPVCGPLEKRCVSPMYNLSQSYDLHLYTVEKPSGYLQGNPFWSKLQMNPREPFTEIVQVPLFPNTRNNGSLFMAAVMVPAGTPVSQIPQNSFITVVGLTKYMPVLYQPEKYLLSNEDSEPIQEPVNSKVPVTHWKSSVKLRLIDDHRNYSRNGLMNDIPWDLPNQYQYKQMFYVDELHLLRHHMAMLSNNKSKEDPSIKFSFQPTSLGAFRFLRRLEEAMKLLEGFGFQDKEKEEVLTLISPDHLYRLALTYIVSLLHTIFAFLAFKNDIGFWKGRDNFVGLSRTTVIGNTVCEIIIFLFLYDSPGTSWLVLGTVGISALINIWKVFKVLKLSVSLKRGARNEEEQKTDNFDSTGMYYLSLILYPLVIGWAIYSLFNHQHRTWWSWFISSAANGVYAFGFLMLTPQIFVNYKLKSVAHLPWRAMTYKVFNTFIDDLFAFIIEMPTIHRIATLRDDIIFFIYLYQRWIYPVDTTRVNEFGYVYQDKADQGPKEESKKDK